MNGSKYAFRFWAHLGNTKNSSRSLAGSRVPMIRRAGGWHEAVLKRLIPDMYPDRSPKDALDEIVERRQQGDPGGYVQTRLMHAAVRQAQTARTLTGLIRHAIRKGATVAEDER